MLDIAGKSLDAREEELLRDPLVGGVILFSRNAGNRAEVCELVAEIRIVAPHLLIAVDQEGGRVQRFREGLTRLPPLQEIGDLHARDTTAGLALAHEAGWLMASEVLACGIDFSFAPVLDVDRDTSSIIGDRSFSASAAHVVTLGRAYIAGMHEAGMCATGKHFPGHGGVVADSHLEAPVDTRSLAELDTRDLIPFRELASELDGIMPAHMTFPAIDAASVGFSSFWLQNLLRTQLGFDGVIFSDDLSMKGADVVGGYPEKARAALQAGCDMVLVCNCPEGADQVLEFLRQADISGSDRLGRLRGKPGMRWSELDGDPRREKIIQQLQQLN